MQLNELLTNDSTLTLAVALTGAVWAAFKSSDLYARLCRKRFNTALHVLESAVEETYRTYVEAIKEARADGKLTQVERRRARALARERAIAIGREQGIDVLTQLGRDSLDLWISRLVKKLKRG